MKVKEETIINLFKDVGLYATPIKRENKTISWQLEGYTKQGGDMIHSLDFSGLDALNLDDVAEAFRNYVDNVDIDDEIELNLESAREWGLTTREFVHDYDDYFERLKHKKYDLIKSLYKLTHQ